LKKHLFNLTKVLFVMLILISSGAALYFQITGSFYDPVKAIQDLHSQNRRDEALDLVKFHKENGTIDLDELEQLEKDLEYTIADKIKSTADGAFTGKVYDTYSGIGAVSSDLTLYGDIRDLGIQFWKYLNDEKTDSIVAALSGAGIVLSIRPFDAIASYAKNAVKYIRNVSGVSSNNGILKKVLKGKLSIKESKLICSLLKKTNGQYLALQQYFQISAT